jgi:predicted secreted protein
MRAFTFVGKAPGTTRLELAYRRAWERDVAPLQMFTTDVTVK